MKLAFTFGMIGFCILINNLEAQQKTGQIIDHLKDSRASLSVIDSILKDSKKSNALKTHNLCIDAANGPHAFGTNLTNLAHQIRGIEISLGHQKPCVLSTAEMSDLQSTSLAGNRADSFCTGHEFQMTIDGKLTTVEPIKLGDFKTLQKEIEKVRAGLAKIANIPKKKNTCTLQEQVIIFNRNAQPKNTNPSDSQGSSTAVE